jgi:hypothetical protein
VGVHLGELNVAIETALAAGVVGELAVEIVEP